MAEAFPEEWSGYLGKREVILTLIALAIGDREKKYALYEWCRLNHVELTAEDVEEVTGRPAGEI